MLKLRHGIRSLAFLALFGAAAQAEVTAIRGSVEAILQEFVGLSAAERDEVFDAFPDTSADLPISVIASLDSNGSDAAGLIAAQFANPIDRAGTNPEEFALNLAIFSESDTRTFEASAAAEEVRSITFRTNEFFGSSDGDTISVRGRATMDGALAIFCEDENRDLTGADVRFRMRVEKSGAGSVFDGEVLLNGAPGGQAGATRTGDIPDRAITIVDLGALNPDFGRLWVVVIAATAVDYEYDAVVGEDFTLTATVELSAENLPDRVGCAAVIGTPFNTLTQVIGLTQDALSADQLSSSIREERDRPSGTPITQQGSDGNGVLGACPLFGFGLIGLALIGLVGVRPQIARC